MEKQGINLARRRTGGGAVYQDLGNTCFSFFSPSANNEQPMKCKDRNNEILVKTLEKLGVKNIKIQGRNDITVDDKKISGSAYQVKIGNNARTLHHGTMLMNVDTKALANYLVVDKQKLVSKGVESVRSRVMNLQDQYKHINHQTLCKALEEEFINYYQPCEVHRTELDNQTLLQNPQIQKIYSELKSKEWIFLHTPSFTNTLFNRFDWGSIELNTVVEQGIITDGRVFSDCLFPEFVDCLNQVLQNGKIEYNVQGVLDIGNIVKKLFFNDDILLGFWKQVEQWLLKNI